MKLYLEQRKRKREEIAARNEKKDKDKRHSLTLSYNRYGAVPL